MLENRKEDLARELQRDYLREWRRKNPEKVKQYNRDYWLRKVEKQSGRESCENDPGGSDI